MRIVMTDNEVEKYFGLFKKSLYDANEYRHSLVPAKLYKFCPLFKEPTESQQRLKCLQENKLWLSTYESLNDPFDLSPFYIDYEKFAQHGYPPETISWFDDLLKYVSKDNIAICSLTKNTWKSMLMWAHYANNHRGFCIEYEVLNAQYIWDVNYATKRLALANSPINLLIETREGNIDNQYLGLILQQNLVKSIEWEYEHEYRILQIKADVPKMGMYGGEADITALGLKVSKIIVGWKCEHYKQLVDIAKSLGCKISLVEPSKLSFQMEEIHGQTKI